MERGGLDWFQHLLIRLTQQVIHHKSRRQIQIMLKFRFFSSRNFQSVKRLQDEMRRHISPLCPLGATSHRHHAGVGRLQSDRYRGR